MGREINNVFSQEKFPKSSWLQKDLSAIFPPKLDLVDPPPADESALPSLHPSIICL